jgi:hypothetical protein
MRNTQEHDREESQLVEATSHEEIPESESRLRKRLSKQHPPIDLDRPASNTHACEPHKRDETKW